MKDMRLRYGILATLCLLLLALLPASCIQDEYAAKEKATVTVTFTTRADGGTTVVGDELEDNERMKTLRVIVSNGNDILYNVYYTDFETDGDGRYYKTITFSELTVNKKGEDFDFYAIANEEGIAGWPTQITSLEQLPENITLSTSSDLIPQTAKATITVVPQQDGGIQSATIPLQFAVAKVRLTINNTSTESQTVSGIELSGVNTTSTNLFGGTSVTSTVTGEALSLGSMNNIPVENNGTPGKSTVKAYFYENTKGVYKLTATWEGHGPQNLDINTAVTPNITEIPRGKMLDINVNLSVNTEPTVNVQVVSWTTKEMDVPAFQ
jgi:hypothetical protein